jgi:hypothetical protein
MSKWISSWQAVRRLRKADPGASEATLGFWAEEGLLRSRATRGDFSSGGDITGRVCWDDTPADADQDDRWPAIPSYFWNWVNAKNGNEAGAYITGIFATYVVPEAERGNGPDSDYIKLYGVSFHLDDLDALLDVRPLTATGARPPQQRWQKQRLTQQQADALKFFDIAITNPTNDPLGSAALHRAYLKWHADPKNKRTGEPFKRSAFGKWQNRYVDGWRVNDSLKLVHNS